MFITKLWRGEYSLAKTYWLFNVLAGFVLGISLSFFNMLSIRTQSENQNVIFGYACLAISYGVIATVGLWKSSSLHKGNSLWAILSKIVACLSGLLLASIFIEIFRLSGGYGFTCLLATLLICAYVSHKSDSEPKKENATKRVELIATTNPTYSEAASTNESWELLSKEFNSNERHEGLWTKCFVEANGDEGKAKLQYLKTRFAEMTISQQHKSSLASTERLDNQLNTTNRSPTWSQRNAPSSDIYSLEVQPRIAGVDYETFPYSSLLSMGMFKREKYKDRTLFYLHNGNVACVSGQLIKVFDTEVFLKKAINNGSLDDKYPSGLLVSFDKDSIKSGA